MKATIDIPDSIYRQVKARSALEGRTIREVAILLFQRWAAGENAAETKDVRAADSTGESPAWFGSLRKYAHHAGGRHDIASIRDSIARGRAEKSE